MTADPGGELRGTCQQMLIVLEHNFLLSSVETTALFCTISETVAIIYEQQLRHLERA